MPLLPSAALLLADNELVSRDATGNASLSANTTAADALQVVCAWPVSGQYGVGTRFL
jgi:hypothetical protein